MKIKEPKSHELEVKNKMGKSLFVSVEYYEENKNDLTPVMEAKDVKTHCTDHHKTKESAVSEMKAQEQKKMEKEALKNKGR
jgi:hypothetical protein